MQNIDRKVTLILNLNKKLQRKGLLLTNKETAIKIPALKGHVLQINSTLNKLTIIENVLINSNYLNY